ncbi:MAG: HD family hydrolase [Candidatus Bathyarchaeia archaeon]
MVSFLQALSDLKNIPRSGWLSHRISIQDVESVADHSFSTSVLSMVLANFEVKTGRGVNVERVLKMALLHDLAEVLTFDISKAYLEYLGARGRKLKNEIEKSACAHLSEAMEPFGISRDYAAVCAEYFKDKTIEAQIVHAADRLDILLQVINLEHRGYPGTMMRNLWQKTSETLANSKLRSVRKIQRMIAKERKLCI